VNVEDEISGCSVGVRDRCECGGTSIRDVGSGARVTVAVSMPYGKEIWIRTRCQEVISVVKLLPLDGWQSRLPGQFVPMC
jgi:hypothetical protein